MTISTGGPNRQRLLATSAAGAWIAAGLVYLILEAIAATRFRPDYSYAHNFISDLGVTSRGMFHGRMIDSPLASLMNTAFYLQGTLFLAGAVLIVRAFETYKAALFLTLVPRMQSVTFWSQPFTADPSRKPTGPAGCIPPARCLRSSEATRPSWLDRRSFGTSVGRGTAAHREGSFCSAC